ncbi:MAG: DUF1353 domain-containing protein [Planctomycetaceae bacterium]|nr:DUF1353 domain-containing protein [Planctomycetaceae bacterium]
MSRSTSVFFFAVASCAALAGCGDDGVVSTAKGPFDPALPETRGPIAGSNNRTLFVLEKEFSFVDSTGLKWTAPKETLTDGASIPQAFLSVLGNQTDIRYLSAAIIHDAYCAEDNKGRAPFHARSWKSVHRMFYDALVASNVDVKTAKLMYAAVYFRGPRWPDPSWANRSLTGRKKSGGSSEPAGGSAPIEGGAPDPALWADSAPWHDPNAELSPHVESVLESKLKTCERMIDEKNPSLDDLDKWMDGVDAMLMRSVSNMNGEPLR